MLILSRKIHESIVIGEDVEITVVEVRGGRVRLGIRAPKEVPVHRREVQDAIEAERNNAGPASAATGCD